MAVVKGKALWAFVQRPNMNLDKPAWTCDVVVDEKTAKALKAEGMSITKKDSGELVFRTSRKVYRKDQGKNTPPLVVDAKRKEFGGNIGNGSLVKVQYKAWDWVYKGKSGKSADLIAVQVLEYIAPPNEAGNEFEDEEGFEAEEQPMSNSEFQDESETYADDGEGNDPPY
jgi:hypothetical protein